MHTLSLLLSSFGLSAQSALPSTAPANPASQGAAASATTVIPELPFAWGEYIQALGILCFALAALWLVLWLVRRSSRSSVASPSSMRIESRLALGPKNWLYVVRCHNKRLILGVSEKNISLISESMLTEEEMKVPAKKPLFPLAGKSGFWPLGKKGQSKNIAEEDDFPLLQQPEPQQQSAFDEFLQDEKDKSR